MLYANSYDFIMQNVNGSHILSHVAQTEAISLGQSIEEGRSRQVAGTLPVDHIVIGDRRKPAVTTHAGS